MRRFQVPPGGTKGTEPGCLAFVVPGMRQRDQLPQTVLAERLRVASERESALRSLTGTILRQRVDGPPQ